MILDLMSSSSIYFNNVPYMDFLFCYLQGWLVDLINKFGTLNGFQILHDRFMSGQVLNVQIIAALIK